MVSVIFAKQCFYASVAIVWKSSIDTHIADTALLQNKSDTKKIQVNKRNWS